MNVREAFKAEQSVEASANNFIFCLMRHYRLSLFRSSLAALQKAGLISCFDQMLLPRQRKDEGPVLTPWLFAAIKRALILHSIPASSIKADF